MKIGRYGSSAISEPIHEPLIPSASNTSGPTQQIDAPMAERIPAIRKPFPFRAFVCFRSDIFSRESTPCTRVRSQIRKIGSPTAQAQLLVADFGEQQSGVLPFCSSLSPATGRKPFLSTSSKGFDLVLIKILARHFRQLLLCCFVLQSNSERLTPSKHCVP